MDVVIIILMAVALIVFVGGIIVNRMNKKD
jgi:hypothetical protein